MTNYSNKQLIPKVIHIIPHDGIGGVEVAARSILKSHFLNNNFKLLLIAGKTLYKEKKNVIESPFCSANNPLAYLRAIFKIYNNTPDVLVCSLWRSIPIGVIVKLLRPKIKLVFFLHLASTVHQLDKLLHKIMLRHCDFIWADSQATLNARVHNLHAFKTYTISFITHKLSPLLITNDQKPILLHFVFWGRINHQKGLDIAIQFIKTLISIGYHCKYDIWGPDDGEQKNLIKLANTLEINDHVKFKGQVNYSDLQKISAQYTFYLQCSRIEGMAMSVLEAMQLGLIPIVTPVGEIKNYCINKKNSIVIDDIKSFKDSADFLESLLDNKEKFDNIRKEAINTWKEKPLYENDFISAANKLFVD